MAQARLLELSEAEDPGLLTDNYRQVKTIQGALSRSEMNVGLISDLIISILESQSWQCWMEPDGTIRRWNSADFRNFIEADRPRGCQTEIALVRKLLEGTNAWEPFLEATRGKPGNPDFDSQPRTDDGSFIGRNRDTITVTPEQESLIDNLATIPISPATPRPRDYSREAPTGDSVSYALRRLSRNRPDLYERVKTGEISANRGMVEAGFKPPKVTVLLNPEAAVRVLVKHFKDDALEALLRGLADWAGYELTPKS